MSTCDAILTPLVYPNIVNTTTTCIIIVTSYIYTKQRPLTQQGAVSAEDGGVTLMGSNPLGWSSGPSSKPPCEKSAAALNVVSGARNLDPVETCCLNPLESFCCPLFAACYSMSVLVELVVSTFDTCSDSVHPDRCVFLSHASFSRLL